MVQGLDDWIRQEVTEMARTLWLLVSCQWTFRGFGLQIVVRRCTVGWFGVLLICWVLGIFTGIRRAFGCWLKFLLGVHWLFVRGSCFLCAVKWLLELNLCRFEWLIGLDMSLGLDLCSWFSELVFCSSIHRLIQVEQYFELWTIWNSCFEALK